MKLKKSVLLISLVLIFALAVSTVAASDNASDITSINEDTSSVQSIDLSTGDSDVEDNVLSSDEDGNADLGVFNNENKLSTTREFNGTTFDELKTAINNADSGDTIVLNRNISQNGVSDILINKTITIIGNGHTIDAQGKSRIFNVSASNVVLNNIIFKNGYADGINGGAIYWSGSYGTIKFCDFINNNASVYRYELALREGGGAIYHVGQDILISNCNFFDNFAVGNEIAWGGAISTIGNYSRIINCNFTDNYVNYTGPHNATNGAGGGAIQISGLNPIIDNCIFANGYARGCGGAINTQSSNGVIKNSIFINNSMGYESDLGGGAINLGGSSNNSTISNCTFINNSGPKGGAIHLGSREPSTIKDSTFINNTEYEICTEKDCYLENNTICNSIWVKAGKVLSKVNILVFNNSTIYAKRNIPARLTAIVTDDKNNVISATKLNFILENGTKISATRDATTGILQAYYTFTQEGVYKVSANTDAFTNYVVYNGTVNVEKYGDFEILQQLINNATEGSAINLTRDYVYTEGMDTITNGIVINKKLTINGNGHVIDAVGKSRIFNITSDNVVLNNIAFTNAYAYVLGGSTSGGAIYCNGSHIGLNGCIFINNKVTHNLTGANMGGAVHFEGSSYVDIYGCYFLNNTAAARGAISTTNCNYFTIVLSYFLNNTALTTWNGAIGLSGNNFIFSNCLFENNKAATGGGVGSFNGDNHIIDNCTFKNNSATDTGCMNWVGHNGIISNSWFIENTAGYHGILCARNVNGTIYNCTFIKNTDSAKAGAININADNVTVSKCTFEENTAKNGGGAIFIGNFFTASGNAYPIIISDCSFTGNGNYEIILDTPANCSFKNNKLSKFMLLTRGNITSKTNIIVLNNATLNVNKGDTVNLTAVVRDDSNNIIIIDDLKFVVENLTIDAVCNNNGVWWANHVFNEYGDYPITVKYNNVSLVNAIVSKAFITTKLNVTIDLPKLDNLTVGNATVDIKVPENVTGNITITVDGVDYVSPINNGTASFNLSSITPGTHNATVKYSGDDVYSPTTTNTTIVIDKIPTPPSDINITNPVNLTSGNATLVVLVPADHTGNITVNIGGQNYTAPINNGTAKVDLNSVKPGNYNATVYYSGDKNHDKAKSVISIKIPEPFITLIGNDLSVLYSASAAYKVLVLSDGKNIKDGENVTITYNGVKYIVKTLNGYATLNLKTTLKVGTYTVTVNYANKTITNKLVIKNIINAKKLKKLKKSKKVNKVKVSLSKVNGKYLKGKKLTLKIKGKKKKLKKFKKGKKYKATVTYGKDVVTKKIKIVK